MVPVPRGGGHVDDDGLTQLKRAIEFNGLYPYVCDGAMYDSIRSDEERRGQLFEELIAAQIREWRALAAERLESGVRCIITPETMTRLRLIRFWKSREESSARSG